jgi:hypothetical protein
MNEKSRLFVLSATLTAPLLLVGCTGIQFDPVAVRGIVGLGADKVCKSRARQGLTGYDSCMQIFIKAGDSAYATDTGQGYSTYPTDSGQDLPPSAE